MKNKLLNILGLRTDNKFKKITDVYSLNMYLDEHIRIDTSTENSEEFIKALKIIRIVNNVISNYETDLLHNIKKFEKTKAFMIKDLVRIKSLKLSKNFILKYIDNRLIGFRVFSLRKKL